MYIIVILEEEEKQKGTEAEFEEHVVENFKTKESKSQIYETGL